MPEKDGRRYARDKDHGPDHPDNGATHSRDGRRANADSDDPLHRLPLVGRFVRESDELRHKIPYIGRHLTRTDADLLRMEARLLRIVAARLEGRARQLDRLAKNEPEPAARRIRVE